MGETKLLQMQNITKAFASNVVLTGVNLSVGEGEVVAILGENGAGKSTLIKILGGIYKADSGEIHINGELKNIHSAAVAGANGIRIIHQEIILVPARTIAANVFMGRELKDKFGLVDAKQMEQETQKVIDDLHLNLRADQLVEDLSIGMQQLVEIIKAVSAEARIVVMDEPTSSLSQGEVETLFDIIRLLKKKGVGIIYISHRLEELFAITDRIVVLRDGKMIGDVPTPEADKDELIKMMVGRELSSYYTRNKHEIKGISLEVKGLEHEKYFKDVNFHARYGEIVGFAGLVGARRTELMKTIFGAYQKSGGEIFLDGKKLEIRRPQDAIDNGIVYVSEDRRDEGLILKNDVKFNMGLVCLSDFIKGVGVKQADWDKMVEDYRKKFSIKITSAKQLAGNLSGGNQQKVVLSKWLAKNPKVIILDEPTRGIDVGSKAEIYAIIDELAASGVSIIMVSSELPEIINMCNRCYVMCEGKITGELSEEEFSQESMMTYATNRE
ncbi:sugar ABC transporter ATP-binding protein [[Clostridium] symbiosum]|uniref:sugar ABC transporter ATP-binding protein n=1 Tax=Clostridium symbiosum TaxID=1512 RepID=UPI001D08E29E|nr:sugar ABC transporter ATP-binding protein [[Clostridium] symbiosum]MCB6607307.1 sugar ABC transporter ATP-binding protein [[Clostridium] symbiosum]MCB6929867.1 sugar ABC transporter ATP-binding protein [[Clostridium] symbiosum]